MTGLFLSVLLLWCCFLPAAVSEKVLPPENVVLSWREGLYQELTWTPPRHSMGGCSYHIASTVRTEGHKFTSEKEMTSSPWFEYRVLQGGFLNVSIQTVCGGRKSDAVIVGIDDPDFQCSCLIMSSTLIRCSWKPAAAQLSFFYNVKDKVSDDFDELRECSAYSGARTGCDLRVAYDSHINVLLNGTLGNATVRNVYLFESFNVRLPPLNWTVEESTERFLIRWIAPELHYDWKYFINYTACTNTSVHEVSEGFVLLRDAQCPYRISLRAAVRSSGGTDWTPDKLYGPVSEPDLMLLAAVLAPLVLAALVVLTLLWCKKNKSKIFPKVPRPNSELFSDLVNNNNMINQSSCYFPKVEEECQVTLVIDPNQPPL